MLTLKEFPWVSLTILLVTYSTLGWLLSAFHDPVSVWVVIVTGILMLAAVLSSPWSKIRDYFTRLFKSDTRAFLFAVIVALSSVAIITWLHVFAHALVVISAGILVRLDAQTFGLSERQAFWLLAIVSLLGLGLGGAAQCTYTQNLD